MQRWGLRQSSIEGTLLLSHTTVEFTCGFHCGPLSPKRTATEVCAFERKNAQRKAIFFICSTCGRHFSTCLVFSTLFPGRSELVMETWDREQLYDTRVDAL
jgi:hypothetical protein